MTLCLSLGRPIWLEEDSFRKGHLDEFYRNLEPRVRSLDSDYLQVGSGLPLSRAQITPTTSAVHIKCKTHVTKS